MSSLAETTVVGRSRATSSAWVGPDSATARIPGISCFRISVMVMSVSGSMPFAASATSCPAGTKGAAARAVERT